LNIGVLCDDGCYYRPFSQMRAMVSIPLGSLPETFYEWLKIAAIVPTNGAPGSVITISGANFGASTGETLSVTFNGAIASGAKAQDDQTIVATVPVGAMVWSWAFAPDAMAPLNVTDSVSPVDAPKLAPAIVITLPGAPLAGTIAAILGDATRRARSGAVVVRLDWTVSPLTEPVPSPGLKAARLKTPAGTFAIL
jgi:hypothetical protein